MYHLHIMNHIIQKTKKYNKPLCLDFVDYMTAFRCYKITLSRYKKSTSRREFKDKLGK